MKPHTEKSNWVMAVDFYELHIWHVELMIHTSCTSCFLCHPTDPSVPNHSPFQHLSKLCAFKNVIFWLTKSSGQSEKLDSRTLPCSLAARPAWTQMASSVAVSIQWRSPMESMRQKTEFDCSACTVQKAVQMSLDTSSCSIMSWPWKTCSVLLLEVTRFDFVCCGVIWMLHLTDSGH